MSHAQMMLGVAVICATVGTAVEWIGVVSAEDRKVQALSEADGVMPIPDPGNPAPLYPPEMLVRGLEGEVRVLIRIAADGTVADAGVLTSSGQKPFDDAAVSATKKWKFKTTGKSPTTVVFPVRFQIPGRRAARINHGNAASNQLKWHKLADLNDPRGFAGQFVGVSSNRLLLYGGTNFPDKPVWDGGVKGWYRDVFVLDDLDAQWRKIGPLPGERAVGYGVSLPYEDGFLCIGGADAKTHTTDVFLLTYDGNELKTRDLPKLPKPCAYMNGGQIGDVIYLAGGIDKPDAVKTMRVFWSLDLKNLDAGWQELEPWPGLPRMLAVSAVHDGAFYLMSGVDLFPDVHGKPMRIYHRDSYRYKPGEGWTKLADAPTPIVAAPSPSMTADDRIIVFGGDEGRLLGFKPMEKHPGFPKTIWEYEVKNDAWQMTGEPPFIPVAVPLVKWRDGYVAASGEVRPAVRSRETWWVQP